MDGVICVHDASRAAYTVVKMLSLEPPGLGAIVKLAVSPDSRVLAVTGMEVTTINISQTYRTECAKIGTVRVCMTQKPILETSLYACVRAHVRS